MTHEPSHPASEDRLMRIEESVAYTERAAEELTAQVLDLHRRLDTVMKRLEQIERRVNEALTPPEPDPESDLGAEPGATPEGA